MKLIGILCLISMLFVSCTSKDQVKQMLKDNPDILAEAIEAHPKEFIDAINKAVRSAQEVEAQKRKEAEAKALADSFKNPLKPDIRKDESFRGKESAPITLVEYSDFECPYCARGYNTVMELLEKYKGKIRFVYKHLPLSFHPQAMISSQYYEAIRLQSEEKAFEFHDQIYKNQSKLRTGEAFLKKLAKDLKVNMTKLAKDVQSKEVKERIEADIAEANKFGFQGTPGFILNGVPVKGAYPLSHFEGIIEKLDIK